MQQGANMYVEGINFQNLTIRCYPLKGHERSRQVRSRQTGKRHFYDALTIQTFWRLSKGKTAHHIELYYCNKTKKRQLEKDNFVYTPTEYLYGVWKVTNQRDQSVMYQAIIPST